MPSHLTTPEVAPERDVRRCAERSELFPVFPTSFPVGPGAKPEQKGSTAFNDTRWLALYFAIIDMSAPHFQEDPIVHTSRPSDSAPRIRAFALDYLLRRDLPQQSGRQVCRKCGK